MGSKFGLGPKPRELQRRFFYVPNCKEWVKRDDLAQGYVSKKNLPIDGTNANLKNNNLTEPNRVPVL